MDLATFFKAEFAEHHDIAGRTEAALSGAFAGRIGRRTRPKSREHYVKRFMRWRVEKP